MKTQAQKQKAFRLRLLGRWLAPVWSVGLLACLDPNALPDFGKTCSSDDDCNGGYTCFEQVCVTAEAEETCVDTSLAPESGRLTIVSETDVLRRSCLEVLTGDLVVLQTELTTLNLPKLREVSGEIKIVDNTSLGAIELPALESAAHLLIENAEHLNTLSIPKLAQLGDLHIKATALSSVGDFGALEKVASVTIVGNAALTSLAGFSDDYALDASLSKPNEAYPGALVIDGNDLLTDLTGLNPPVEIPGALVVTNCAKLTSLNGLENVDFIRGGIKIENNPLLRDICALTGISRWDGIQESFSIVNNASLPYADAHSGLFETRSDVYNVFTSGLDEDASAICTWN